MEATNRPILASQRERLGYPVGHNGEWWSLAHLAECKLVRVPLATGLVVCQTRAAATIITASPKSGLQSQLGQRGQHPSWIDNNGGPSEREAAGGGRNFLKNYKIEQPGRGI